MPEQDGLTPINPINPNLQGAVDLASPTQNAGRAFLQQMAQQGGQSIVMFGITPTGVMAVNYTPGGLVEVLGLSLLGALTTWHSAQHGGRAAAPSESPHGHDS